jgi:hypothetical protein
MLTARILSIVRAREVCQDSPASWREYKRGVEEMVREQKSAAFYAGKAGALADATFDHQGRRCLGGAFREDRWGKGSAAHWICNVEKG